MLTDTELRNTRGKSKAYNKTERDGLYVLVTPSGGIAFIRALQALVECYEEFFRNVDFGIASFLGRRIHHGTLRGTLLNGLPDAASVDLPPNVLAQYAAWKKEFSASIVLFVPVVIESYCWFMFENEPASLALQRRELERYAGSQGFDLVAVYQDVGKSGMLEKRSGLSRLLFDVVTGKANLAQVLLGEVQIIEGIVSEEIFEAAQARFLALDGRYAHTNEELYWRLDRYLPGNPQREALHLAIWHPPGGRAVGRLRETARLARRGAGREAAFPGGHPGWAASAAWRRGKGECFADPGGSPPSIRRPDPKNVRHGRGRLSGGGHMMGEEPPFEMDDLPAKLRRHFGRDA